MKATSFFRKAMATALICMASVMNFNALAQDEHFITNEETQNGLVTTKTVYRQDGSQLYRHMRYEYTYDDQQRITGKTAEKWDGATDEWVPYYRMTYTYGTDKVTLSYARWDEAHKAYDKQKSQQVYQLNDERMPVASL